MYIQKTHFLYIFISYLVILLPPPSPPMRELYFFQSFIYMMGRYTKICFYQKMNIVTWYQQAVKHACIDWWRLLNQECWIGSRLYIYTLTLLFLFSTDNFFRTFTPKGSIYIRNQTSLLSCYFYSYWFRFYLGRLKKSLCCLFILLLQQ